ncbi:hypothetical protein F511_35643, partial [Dorcoceras hygrometricum]
GATSFLDVPKETVVEMRKRFFGSEVPFRAPSKKREMKMEFRLLHDIVAKALCAKAGSFDMVTSDRFDLMVSIFAGLKDEQEMSTGECPEGETFEIADWVEKAEQRLHRIQLAVGPQPLWLRNHNSGPAQRIMVKRLATSPHDPLGITDSACKNQSVVVSVQYGPFNPYIPIRSATIGRSRVAMDPIAMHTSWRSNSEIASVTRVSMTFRVMRTNQYNQDLGLIHSTNGNHLESPKEGSSIDHQAEQEHATARKEAQWDVQIQIVEMIEHTENVQLGFSDGQQGQPVPVIEDQPQHSPDHSISRTYIYHPSIHSGQSASMRFYIDSNPSSSANSTSYDSPSTHNEDFVNNLQMVVYNESGEERIDFWI